MSLQPVSRRSFEAPVRNTGLSKPVENGTQAQTPQVGWARFRDIFTGGSKTGTARLPTSPQTEPQKTNNKGILNGLRDFFGDKFPALGRLMKAMMSMTSPKPMLPPPNTLR